jgi:hypothetical protein
LSHLGFVYSIVRYGYEMYKFRQKVGLVSFYKTKKFMIVVSNEFFFFFFIYINLNKKNGNTRTTLGIELSYDYS